MFDKYIVIYSPLAREDIFGIARYIGEQSQDQDVPLRWEAALYERIRRLEAFPNSHPRYQVSQYRKIHHGPYVVLYRVDPAEMVVKVCRVFHGARLSENIGPLES